MTEEQGITLYPGPRLGAATLPPSKSHLQRLMLAAFLAGKHCPKRKNEAEDVQAMREALAVLEDEKNRGEKGSERPILSCHSSGATLRFLMPVAMMLYDKVDFVLSENLAKRPLEPFLEILNAHGVKSSLEPGEHETILHLKGHLHSGKFLVPGNISSQIVSGLLFALPLGKRESRIRLTTALQSKGYVEMSLQVLRDFQIQVEEAEDGYLIPGNQRYVCPTDPNKLTPEKDWSAASPWIAMDILGANIDILGLNLNSLQPDRAIFQLVRRFGKTINLSQYPDLFPALAVAASKFDMTTKFTGVGRLKLKESNRLQAMFDLLNALGISCSMEKNHFSVLAAKYKHRGAVTIDPKNDHRIAMAAAAGAIIADEPVTILHPECVKKSYPDFFQQFQSMAVCYGPFFFKG